MPNPLRAVIALALALGLLIAGCGGDDDEGSGGPDDPPIAADPADGGESGTGGDAGTGTGTGGDASGDDDSGADGNGGDGAGGAGGAGGDAPGTAPATAAGAEDVIREYMVAAANGDGDTACALFSEDGIRVLREAYAQQGGETPSCEEIFGLVKAFREDGGEPTFDIGDKSIPVDELDRVELDVRIDDAGRARARIAGVPGGMTLERSDGRWQIGDVTG